MVMVREIVAGVLGTASLHDCRFAADFAALVAVVGRDIAEIRPRYSRDAAEI